MLLLCCGIGLEGLTRGGGWLQVARREESIVFFLLRFYCKLSYAKRTPLHQIVNFKSDIPSLILSLNASS